METTLSREIIGKKTAAQLMAARLTAAGRICPGEGEELPSPGLFLGRFCAAVDGSAVLRIQRTPCGAVREESALVVLDGKRADTGAAPFSRSVVSLQKIEASANLTESSTAY